MSDVRGSRSNPYVGARPFERGEPLHGRDRETMDLLHLLVAERIVLLHSPSGAGKTSLIQAALIPRLERRGFEVLPAMRVGLGPAPGLEPPPQGNRYVLSLLACLEGETDEAGPDRVRAPGELTQLATMTLAQYLDRRASRSNGQKVMLVFDQFEEILTLDPTDREAKREFFAQVGEALRGRRCWALFVMRDDHVAALAPYIGGLPTQLGTTYRLDLLSEASARLAIREPALRAQVDFTEGAVDRLVGELCQVRVQALDGMTQVQQGPFVEPIQLQLVCRRLWEKLPPGATRVAEADVAAVGAVDSVLADYYAERVAAIARQTDVAERTIRDWFDRHLITEQGIRGQVLQGPEESQGLENRAIRPLVDAYLVRAERRRGATWFELAHDRLIEPVRADNEAWLRAHPLAPPPAQAALGGSIGAGLALGLLRAAMAILIDPHLGPWGASFILYSYFGATLGAALNLGVALGWYLLLNRSIETEGKPSPRQAFMRPDRLAAVLAVGLGTTFFGVAHMSVVVAISGALGNASLVPPMGFLAGLALSVAASRRPTPFRWRVGRHPVAGGWLLRLLVVILTFGLVQWVFIKAGKGQALAIVLPGDVFAAWLEDRRAAGWLSDCLALLDSVLVGLALALGTLFGLNFVADRLAKWLKPVASFGR